MAQSEDDICYALHEFTAENPDELSFAAGELIVILERDDQYGDGWFQGRNRAGEIGLFPQSYTSPSPPSPTDDYDASASPIDTFPSPHSQTPEPALAAHLHDVERVLGQLQVTQASPYGKNGSDAHSIHSAVSREEDDDTGPVLNPRAVLAAKAAENAERDAREEKEQADKRRQADQEAYMRNRQSGIIEGLQLSDESEDDDEDDIQHPLRNPASAAALSGLAPPATPPRGLGRAPSNRSIASEANGTAAVSTSETSADMLNAPTVTAANLTPSGMAGSPLLAPSSASARSRSNTVGSNYAESTYSSTSPPMPVPSSNGFTNPAEHETETLSATTPAEVPTAERPPSPRSPSPRPPSSRSPSPLPHLNGQATMLESFKQQPLVLQVVEAGVAGAGAVGAAILAKGATTLGLNHPTTESEDHPPTVSTAIFPPTPETTQVETVPAHSTSVLSSNPVSTPAVLSARAITPTPVTTTTSSAPFQPSPSASLTSRSSSRLDSHAPRTAASTGTGETSPRESSAWGGQGTAKELPYDPRDWNVDQVVEWGRTKSFDALTLSKFQEHEISGDVLLEMDVAMLKEIDLTAFGRRVHIYNAIKELRSRLSHSTSVASDILRPVSVSGLTRSSGYEPDSPSTASFASPQQGSQFVTSPRANVFTPPLNVSARNGNYQQSIGESEHSIEGSLMRSTDDHQVLGLGLDEDRTPGPALRSTKSRPTMGSGQSHSRSATADSLNTAPEAPIDDRIPEEKEEDLEPKNDLALSPIPTSPLSQSTPTMSGSRRVARQPKSRAGSVSDSSATAQSSPKEGAGKMRKSERTFFGATLGRSRKPPPRVPSAYFAEDPLEKAIPRPRKNNLSSSTASKRTTRLFGFSSNGSGDNTPKNNGSVQNPRDGPSSMSQKAVEPASSEMMKPQPEVVKDGNLLEKIGTPDYSGWMRKKGEKYNSWKQRFFVLKGFHLYYLKSESEQRVKGFINLQGYRIISDPNIHPGEFAFKIVHDTDREHYFSAAEQVTVRTWMKEIMKATIGRDYSVAVVSSCNIETMPLAVAQTMNPRPRPPSPASRARVQKERYAGANPNTLTPGQAQILMEFSAPTTITPSTSKTGATPRTSPSKSEARLSKGPGALNGLFAKDAVTTLNFNKAISGSTTSVPTNSSAHNVSTLAPPAPIAPALDRSKSSSSSVYPPIPPSPNTERALINWVNSTLPASIPMITDLGNSLRSGEVIVRTLEKVSGTSSGITRAEFATFHPPGAGQAFPQDYFDVLFNIFDYISPLVSTEDISMDDMLSGNEPRLVLLLERIRAAFPQRS